MTLRRYVGLSEKMRKLAADVSGATAIEYGLIAALVGVALIGALTLLGPAVSNVFNKLTNFFAGV